MTDERVRVVVGDDHPMIRDGVVRALTASGAIEVLAEADDGTSALEAIRTHRPQVALLDYRMPGMDGIAFLKRLMGLDSGLPVILITGHGDVPMAVEAMRIGAMDFMEKPFNPDRMTELAKKATQARRITLDNRALRRDLERDLAYVRRDRKSVV